MVTSIKPWMPKSTNLIVAGSGDTVAVFVYPNDRDECLNSIDRVKELKAEVENLLIRIENLQDRCCPDPAKHENPIE